MARPFRMPDLGEGIHEGEILAVRVAVGDRVQEGDPILEVETDKAAVEIPSPFSGSVTEINVTPGEVVVVGQALMIFDGGDARSDERPAPAEATEPPPPDPKSKTGAAPAGPVPASPATRRLARELGVDLTAISASGPAGRVTAEDVRTFAAASGDDTPTPAPQATSAPPADASTDEPALPDFGRWGPVQRVAFRSLRRSTARQMSLAWSRIPHVTNQDSADVTKLEDFRQRHKSGIEARGGKLTLTVFALKAAATALKAYPGFNSSLDEASGEIVVKNYFHLGVAVETPKGLIVPVIRDVDRKSITELAIELYDLAQRTRQRKVALEELQGGTFTITNAGPMGGGHFAPIINYPEAAILGMGYARQQAVVVDADDGTPIIAARLMMPLVLCFDHRLNDGAAAIGFMRTIIAALEDPDELLMTMI